MNTLIWKQYAELRSSLLVMILFGIAMVPILSYFNYRETSMLVFVLFCFAGPILSLQIGIMVFKPEFAENTIHFLDQLPVARHKIWVVKVFSGLAMVFILYVSYLLICQFGFNDHVSLNQPLGSALRAPVPLLVLAPLFLFGYGVINALLPVWASIVLLLSLVWLGFIVIASGLLFFVNWTLMIPMLSVAMLIVSRHAFIHGEMGDANARLWRVCKSGALGMVVLFVLTIGLDQVAQSRMVTSMSSAKPRPVAFMADNSLIVSFFSESAWYDPINASNLTQYVRIAPKTGEKTSIGPRMSNDLVVGQNGTVAAFSTAYQWPGIVGLGFTSTNRNIVPHCRLMLFDPSHSSVPVAIDDFASPICFSKSDSLWYYRYRNAATEIVEAAPGKPRVVVASFSVEPGIYRYDAHLDMIVVGEYRGMNATVINCSTRQVTPVKRLWAYRPPQKFGPRSVYRIAAEYDSNAYATELIAVDEHGTLERLAWLPLDTLILGNDASGSPLAIIPDQPASATTQTRRFTLVRVDIEQKKLNTLLELGECYDAAGRMSRSGNTCYIQRYPAGIDRELVVVDLTVQPLTLRKTATVRAFADWDAIDDSTLLLRRDTTIEKLDWRTNATEKLL